MTEEMKKDFPWLQHYPEGVPAEVDITQYRSLVELVKASVDRFGDNNALIHEGVRYSYGQIYKLAQQFAVYLQQHTDLEPGDRIAMQMPNLPQYYVAMFGAHMAGLIVVNTNPLYTEREMLHQFTDAEAKAIVILTNFASKLESIRQKSGIKHIILTEVGDLMGFPKKQIVNFVVKSVKKMVPAYSLPGAVKFTAALAKGKGKQPTPVDIKPEDIAFLQYTGGTTGVSKGAMLSHQNIIANVIQMRAWMMVGIKEEVERVLTPLPLYHIFSLTVNCFLFWTTGNEGVLITNPRDLPKFIKTMKQYPFTVMTGVNTLYNALMNHPDFKTVDFSSVKFCVAGGMALQQPVAKRWLEATGKPVVEGYGLTESSPVLSCNRIDGQDRPGTIGLVFPSTEVRIMDENMDEVPRGERGELCGKGPQVMKGYWNRPDETAKTLAYGWLKTGDIAIMEEDGYMRIVDRKKDMILVSGFNVYPNEVEDVVAAHPKVAEVAAIGVPDDKSTEVVKLFVVKKDESLTEDELRAFCKENLTAYKVPKHYEFRAELPKSNVGKILRRKLRD